MGYYEVLNYLVNKRASGDESFSTVPQIMRALKDRGYSDNGISGICIKLEYDGYAEARMNSNIKNWLRVYRATSKAVEGRYG
jgi:microsomal dipeptidase-like Zn-dependent dipeptidase